LTELENNVSREEMMKEKGVVTWKYGLWSRNLNPREAWVSSISGYKMMLS